MIVKNPSKGSTLATECRIADTFFKRFKGLMGEKKLEIGNGLLIIPCNSIHMFFMKFPLDIVFLDRSNTVVYTVENIKPWRVSKIISGAHCVIELPAGTVKATCTRQGDQLSII